MEVRIDWVPGHAGGRGNNVAHACASEKEAIRSDPDIPVPFVKSDFDPVEQKAAARKADRRRLLEHTPVNPAYLPSGLPRGAKVLIHEARARAACITDILAKWRKYTPKRGRPLD